MNTFRLTSVNDVVRNWGFISSGLIKVGHHLRYSLTLDEYRKILFTLARRHSSAWLGIATVDAVPVAFIVAHDCTPLFAKNREFEVSMYYHTCGYASAITALQSAFEEFRDLNNIHRYYLITRHKAGRPLPVFSVGWSGMKHAYKVYQKDT